MSTSETLGAQHGEEEVEPHQNAQAQQPHAIPLHAITEINEREHRREGGQSERDHSQGQHVSLLNNSQ